MLKTMSAEDLPMHEVPLASVPSATQGGPLFIVMNAGAGHSDTEGARDTLVQIFREAGREHEFILLENAASLTEAAQRAVALARERGGVVVAAGGDGTINGVAQVVLGSGCPFGVLPQGTFNYFGRMHGIPQDTEAAARGLLRATVQEVQVGLVNDRIFLVNGSLGLYPKLLEERETLKSQLGRSRAVAMLAGLRTLLRKQIPQRLTLECDGLIRTVLTPTLFVGNNALQLERLGFKEAAALQRGQIAAVVVRPAGLFSMLTLILRSIAGRLGEAEKVDAFAFRRLTVSSRRKRSFKVATDGEIHWLNAPLVFQVAPEPLLLLVPQPEDQAEIA